ncbi:hypothetical protein S245_034160, partial [Arachis hypogaea]
NGPISAKAMQRKAVNRRSRKHVRPNELARPEELGRGPREVKADTDKNILTMFNILRKNNVVKLENLILNRNSFAQTAEIKVNEAGSQLVVYELLRIYSTRNVPRANEFVLGMLLSVTLCSDWILRIGRYEGEAMAVGGGGCACVHACYFNVIIRYKDESKGNVMHGRRQELSVSGCAYYFNVLVRIRCRDEDKSKSSGVRRIRYRARARDSAVSVDGCAYVCACYFNVMVRCRDGNKDVTVDIGGCVHV